MIVGHADCNAINFSNSFTKLGQELFPAYEFRQLPADHLIYDVHFKMTSRPVLKEILKKFSGSWGVRKFLTTTS